MRTDYTVTPNRTLFYQDDHEGSVTHLTDGTAKVIESYRYDAFGKPSVFSSTSQPLNSSAINNGFFFTGREYVQTFGIYEYRNRAYHPGLGRFMSEDPKGFDAGDYNLFRYVHNDPEDLTDPMGLDDPVRTPDANGLLQTPRLTNAEYLSRGVHVIWFTEHPFAAQHVDRVSVTGEGDSKTGQVKQAAESYDPNQLRHGADPWAMTREGASGAYQAGQSDRREYHTFTFQNPANKNDFASTPVRISGKNGATNETWLFDKGQPMATVGNYKFWGVGMNHVRYVKDQIYRDLGKFHTYHVNGVIMTPSPTSGSAIVHNPPYSYDVEHNSTYGP